VETQLHSDGRPVSEMKRAEHPFQFFTAAYLVRIGNQKATNLAELREGLETCSDASIFYHTFQSQERYHFLTEFSNDFAQWILASLNRPELAEQLAAIDIRSYLALNDLHSDLLRVLDEFCNARPEEVRRPAFEPFHFKESVEVTVPLSEEAWTLEDFHHQLERLSNASFHFHFLASRLRLHLRTNDFSLWFENELGLKTLAQRANAIDIYTNTVESAKARLATLIDRELAK
jgi:hypothetical protein